MQHIPTKLRLALAEVHKTAQGQGLIEVPNGLGWTVRPKARVPDRRNGDSCSTTE